MLRYIIYAWQQQHKQMPKNKKSDIRTTNDPKKARAREKIIDKDFFRPHLIRTAHNV